MASGLGNPHRLAGAARKRERLAWERIAAGIKCDLRSCRYDAVGLVCRWDGGLGHACAIHLDEGERRGFRVLRGPSEAVSVPVAADRAPEEPAGAAAGEAAE